MCPFAFEEQRYYSDVLVKHYKAIPVILATFIVHIVFTFIYIVHIKP